MAKFTKKQYMDALIKATGDSLRIGDIKQVMKKDLGADGFESFFSSMPKGSFGVRKGDIADETIYFHEPTSKSKIKTRSENAMLTAPNRATAARKRAKVKAAKARTQKILDSMSDENKKSFDDLGDGVLELKGNNKGGLAKKTKS